MTFNLTNDECIDYFYNALCNGMNYLYTGYGLEITYKNQDYKDAKAKLSNPCIEDVLVQILKDGKPLLVIDNECEGEYNREIRIEDVYNNLPKTPIEHLTDMINENDDANTADVILQTVFFKETVFG